MAGKEWEGGASLALWVCQLDRVLQGVVLVGTCPQQREAVSVEAVFAFEMGVVRYDRYIYHFKGRTIEELLDTLGGKCNFSRGFRLLLSMGKEMASS